MNIKGRSVGSVSARARKVALALARAIPWIRGLLASSRRSPEPADHNAGSMFRSGRYEEAVAAYQRAVRSQPSATGPYVNMGHALCHLGRWEEAAAAYERARKLDPDVPGVCANLGDALLRCGRWEGAIGAYRGAIRERPGAASCHVNLGHALLELNRNGEAVAAYRRARELDPGLPGLAGNLANASFKFGDWDVAVAEYQAAIRERPDDALAHVSLGHALCCLERWGEAAAAYQLALGIDPRAAEVQRKLAVALSQAERAGTDETDGRDEPVAPPEDEGTRPRAGAESEAWAEHHARGDSLLMAGRTEEAIAAYELAIGCQPTATASYVNMGHGLCHLGRWQAAAAAYSRAQELDPGVAGVCANLGDVLTRLDRWDEATDCYRAATRERPGEASPQVNLGHALWRLNRWDEAATAYLAALRLDSGLVEVRRLAAFALSAAGRLEEAVGAYQEAIKEATASERRDRAGSNPVRLATEVSSLHRSLGDVLLKLQRWDEAATAQRRADEFNPSWSRSAPDPGAEVGRWAARGWSETGAKAPPGPRLMFVLDSDYGELTTVMLLLFGQEMAARATLLLSPRLYVSNRDVLPGRTRPMTSVEDVMQAVDRERPDVVFLCSGYLFSIHELLSLEALERLVRFLREKGCRIVTTDPFLGLLSGLGSSTTVSIDIPSDASPELKREKERQDAKLLAEFSASFRILENVPHLYPTYPAPLGQEAASDPRILSFYNQTLLCPAADGSAARLDSAPGRAAGAAQKPRWLFILATRDYVAQVMYRGKEAFVDIAIDKIQETLAAGRHPVFVAPHDLIQSIIAKMPPTQGVTLLTFCPFRTFLTLLLDAEFAFYWNVVSHSMLLRLMNQRPFFMFDLGHLIRNVTPLQQRVIDWYYQGRGPMMLRQERGLDLDELRALARDSAAAAGQVSRGLCRAPTPDAMVAGLLDGARANDPERRERPSPSLA